MASKRTKYAVGLFIAAGVGLALLAFILLGVAQLFRKGQFYVTFFDESVQGLTEQSPVKYRGVPVGAVERIKVAPDSKLVEVVMRIESGLKLDRTIVAQLKPVGITGSMFIELSRMTPGEPNLSPKITFPAQFPIVASKPSEISTLFSGINDLLKQLRSLDLDRMVDRITAILDSMNQTIASADVRGVSEDVRSSLQRLNRLLDQKRWDRIMSGMEAAVHSFGNTMTETDKMAKEAGGLVGEVRGVVSENAGTIRSTLTDLQKTMEQANSLMEKGNRLANRTDERVTQLYAHLLATGQNVQGAAEDLRLLLERLSEQPSLLLFGGPPPRKKVIPGNSPR